MELLFTANHRIARNVNIFTCEKGYPSRTYNGDSVFVPVMDNITVRKKKNKKKQTAGFATIISIRETRTQVSECMSLVLEDSRITCTRLYVEAARRRVTTRCTFCCCIPLLILSLYPLTAVNDLVRHSWKFDVTYASRCGYRSARGEKIFVYWKTRENPWRGSNDD